LEGIGGLPNLKEGSLGKRRNFPKKGRKGLLGLRKLGQLEEDQKSFKI